MIGFVAAAISFLVSGPALAYEAGEVKKSEMLADEFTRDL